MEALLGISIIYAGYYISKALGGIATELRRRNDILSESPEQRAAIAKAEGREAAA